MSELRALRRNGKAMVGAAILAGFVLIAIVGPWLVGDPSLPVGRPLEGPSWAHWLGTTGQGQDVLVQTIAGARGTLAVAFAVGALVTSIGALIGITSGYLGGRVDRALSLMTNVFLVIPGLPLAIVLAAYLRSGPSTLVIVLAASGWAWHARVFRAQAMTLARRDYVAAAQVAGERHARVIVGELLPNMTSLLAAAFIGATTYALGAVVGLEFLGLGDLGAVTWGSNLYWAANDAALLTGSWWVFVPTGACIALVGFALTLANVALDELTNPRLRPRHDDRGGVTSKGAPAAKALLAIEDLRVRYGATVAVDGVSFDIGQGEVVGLAGESGSGKSTIGYTLLRLLDESACTISGAVRFADKDVLALDERGLREHRWAGVAMVFQSALDALNPVLSAGEQVMDVLRARAGLDRDAALRRAIELFELVGLEPRHLRAFPHQLSGGMRQRVVIAIALALRPQLLVMDEPTTALDVIVQREILERVAALRRELGLSILIISHDLPVLLAFCDRVGVMQRGRLVEIAAPSQLQHHAHDPYTQKLLAAFPSLDPPARDAIDRDDDEAPLLEVKDAVRTFRDPRSGALAGVAGVSFELAAGEVVALVGESGSGKSTLARLLVRLDRLQRGAIRIGGADALRMSLHEHRRRVQLVFQDPFASLNPTRRVRHHLARPLALRGVPAQTLDAEIASLLTSVGLEPAFARRFPHELSGGQRQRVALARALAARPELLVLDEPTSMLDASLRADLLALLRGLARDRGERRLGVLLVTHDLASAAAIADRVMVLHQGRIVEHGDIAATLADPRHPYTRRLLRAARYSPRVPEPDSHEPREALS